MKRTLSAVVGALLFASTIAGADAVGPIDSIARAASATAQARSAYTVTDVVSVYNRANAIAPDVVARTAAAVESVRGAWAFGRGASVGMASIRRGSTYVQQVGNGFTYAMSVTVLPLNAVGPLMGRDIASVLAGGAVVMGQTTADLRDAKAGDVIDLVAASGAVVSFPVGLVVDDAVVGGTEILMSPVQAGAVGIAVESRVVVWGFSSRAALDAAFSAFGVESRADVRVRRSWDAFDPDSTIGMAATKKALGEFVYRANPNGTDITVNSAWEAAYIPPVREVLVAPIPIRARCNVTILSDLRAALDDVAAAGLASAIDVDNANAYGGCYYPRFNRISGQLGFLSRHSWGQALDTNTTTNAEGATPMMNCDVVRIFRRHNFAWGGNFLTPDGMHFEWVGGRRDQYQYPSRYCPNLPVAPGTESGPTARTDIAALTPIGRSTLFIEDGFANGE
jgi:hypothetical protein